MRNQEKTASRRALSSKQYFNKITTRFQGKGKRDKDTVDGGGGREHNMHFFFLTIPRKKEKHTFKENSEKKKHFLRN